MVETLAVQPGGSVGADAAPAGLHARLVQAGPIPIDARLDCAPGEVLALVGPSGSGKSTLLRMIAGLVHCERGIIRCGGETWFDTAARVRRSPQQRRVGFVFQRYALFPHLSALGNVFEACDPAHPRAQREAAARALLARVRLTGLEHRRPDQLSGGQQQRVAVARALAREPRVLLLDEPFSAVDRATRERLHQELAELRGELGMPMVLVTHDLDEAMLLADRLCVLSRGRTLQAGVPERVLAEPDSAEVARLLGHRNLFRGQVQAHDVEAGHTWIEWRGLSLAARLQTAWPPGTQVSWVVPSPQVIVVRTDRPRLRERANLLTGTVESAVRLGGFVSLELRVGGAGRPPVFASLSLHAARHMRLAPGAQATLSIDPEGIHLMPHDADLPRPRRGGAPAAG